MIRPSTLTKPLLRYHAITLNHRARLRRQALDPNMPRGICVTGDLPIIQVDGPFSSITASPTKKHPQFAAQNATGASTCTFVLKGSRQKTANKGRRNSAARAGV